MHVCTHTPCAPVRSFHDKTATRVVRYTTLSAAVDVAAAAAAAAAAATTVAAANT